MEIGDSETTNIQIESSKGNGGSKDLEERDGNAGRQPPGVGMTRTAATRARERFSSGTGTLRARQQLQGWYGAGILRKAAGTGTTGGRKAEGKVTGTDLRPVREEGR